jgi:hypothetical protein
MKSNYRKSIVAAACLTAAGFTATAAPLHRADVAANPVWLAHVDFDGLRPTPIGQHILAEMNKPEADAKLAAFKAIVSVDPRTQLHGVTVYSVGSTPQDGVLLVYADFDAERLVTLAKAAKDAQNNTYKQHVIYNWIDEKQKAKHGVKPRIYAAIDGARVVFGKREERVAQALDVLDGLSPTLASSAAFPELGAPGDTSFLEAVASRFDFAAGDPNAAVFRLSKQGLLQLSAVQNQLNGLLSLEARDEEIAGHMAAIGQGLIALMKLQQEKPETVKLAEALTLKQDGSRVTLHLSMPMNEALEIMKADAARKAQKQAQKAEAK